MIHIVLYNPEIPQNTGNIMRTCIAAKAKLHLIEPLGFSLEEKYIKRSGAGYVEYVDLEVHKSWQDFMDKNPQGKKYYSTRYGHKTPNDFDFKTDIKEDIYLIFGAESCGIPKLLLKHHLDSCIRLPMADKVRALNLSNVVCCLTYEVLRQNDYYDLEKDEPDTYKGKAYLENYPEN